MDSMAQARELVDQESSCGNVDDLCDLLSESTLSSLEQLQEIVYRARACDLTACGAETLHDAEQRLLLAVTELSDTVLGDRYAQSQARMVQLVEQGIVQTTSLSGPQRHGVTASKRHVEETTQPAPGETNEIGNKRSMFKEVQRGEQEVPVNSTDIDAAKNLVALEAAVLPLADYDSDSDQETYDMDKI